MQSGSTDCPFCVATVREAVRAVQLESQVLACEGVSLGGQLPAARYIALLLHRQAQTAKGGRVLMVHV
jgi:hypothetical protein